ncbi:hypothetical protein B1R27_23930 [Streptomyces sp. GKU 895]|nr:hypothetical protein B1R27_23930 [Streptomyces sp. GKU 895]
MRSVDVRALSFWSCLRGGESQQLGYALGLLKALEAGEEVVDELDAAGCSQAAGEEQAFRGGGAAGSGSAWSRWLDAR